MSDWWHEGAAVGIDEQELRETGEMSGEPLAAVAIIMHPPDRDWIAQLWGASDAGVAVVNRQSTSVRQASKLKVPKGGSFQSGNGVAFYGSRNGERVVTIGNSNRIYYLLERWSLPIDNRTHKTAGLLTLAIALTLLTSVSAAAKSTSHHARTSTSHHSSKQHQTAAHTRGQRSIDSDRTREIQSALIRERYLSGQPSGHWDQTSKDAMIRYQADNGWQTKITPDSRALIKLGLGPDHKGLLNPDTASIASPHELGADNQTRPGGASDSE